MSIERARSISIAVLLLYSFRAQIVICASRTQIVPMYRGPQRHVSNAVLLRVPFSFSVSSSLMSSVFYPAPWILYLIPGRASSGSGIWEAPPARCTSSPRSPLLSVSVSVSASASAPMSVPADDSTAIQVLASKKVDVDGGKTTSVRRYGNQRARQVARRRWGWG